MKPISEQAQQLIKARKISANVDFEPNRETRAGQADEALLTSVSAYLKAKQCMTTKQENGVTRKEINLWVFTREELREFIEKIQGL